jgi:hypothetical protein
MNGSEPGNGHTASIGVERDGALAAAGIQGRSGVSLSGVAASVGRCFDRSAVGGRYADLGSALATGIESASASIGRWSGASGAVADAVRASVRASDDVDQHTAGVIGRADA